LEQDIIVKPVVISNVSYAYIVVSYGYIVVLNIQKENFMILEQNYLMKNKWVLTKK